MPTGNMSWLFELRVPSLIGVSLLWLLSVVSSWKQDSIMGVRRKRPRLITIILIIIIILIIMIIMIVEVEVEVVVIIIQGRGVVQVVSGRGGFTVTLTIYI